MLSKPLPSSTHGQLSYCENLTAKLLLTSEQKSEEIIPALRLEVGVVFIDGWHEYEQVKKDIEVCGPKLKEGGIMIFHDFASYHNHVGRAVKELGVQYWNPIPQLAVVVKKGEANAFN